MGTFSRHARTVAVTSVLAGIWAAPIGVISQTGWTHPNKLTITAGAAAAGIAVTVKFLLLRLGVDALVAGTYPHDSYTADAERIAGANTVKVHYRPDGDDALSVRYLCGTSTIIVDDEFNRLADDERDAILAHELGHRAHTPAVWARALFAATQRPLMVTAAFGARSILAGIGVYAALQALYLLTWLTTLAVERANEHDADNHARTLGFGEQLAGVLVRESKDTRVPQFLHPHPAPHRRQARLAR